MLELAKIGFANMADYMQAGAMPNTITGLSSLLSKIPSPAPQPDTILGRGIYGEGINPIDPIERQPPDIGDRISRDKDQYEWGPTGQGQGWGRLWDNV